MNILKQINIVGNLFYMELDSALFFDSEALPGV